MDDNTPQGAAKSAQYFLKLYTYAFATGDTSQLAAMSDDECVFCNSVIGNVKQVHDPGGWADHWDFEIESTRYGKPENGEDYLIIEFTLTNPGTLLYQADGTSKQTDAEANQTLRISLAYASGRWTVRGGGNVK
ncbi:DUF6318 family protein [Actinomyces bovis]|nr:DUF6318 family protein [Actinomyces bovis]